MSDAKIASTRRRFMTHFASIGLGTTLAPGIVWARMQDAGTDKITLEMLTDALKLAFVGIVWNPSLKIAHFVPVQ